jgi:RNA polymerase sigma factor (sigma-70 family)
MIAARNASLVLRCLRELAADEVADHELLERFTVQRDDAAFAALVRRYGRLVSSVCRAVLRNEHDTEDVFQATFLVLARKAGSIRKRDALTSWLYGVAYRLANKARRQAVKRCRPMPVTPRPKPVEPLEELAWRELNAALHGELAQLPAIYCSPVVLCCLEGCSRDEAAKRLGLPMATVKHRLERGRELLRHRLAQRGLAPSAALAAAAITAGRGSAAPAGLIHNTTAGILGRAALSHRAVVLAQEVLQNMFTTKLTIGSIFFCGVVLTLLAVGLWGTGPRESLASAQETKAALPVVRPNKDQPAAQEAPQFPAEPEQGEDVMAVKYGSTGEWMATAEMDGTVRLWNIKTQRLGPVLRGPNRMVRSVAFTPDSETLVASSDDGKIYVWDVRMGKLRMTLEGHSGWVCSVALASDGKTLASSARSFEQGIPSCRELKIWDLARGKLVRDIECNDDIASGGACSLAFAPETRLLAAACCGEFRGIKVWDATTGKEVKRFTYNGGFPLAIAISPNGKWLASGGGVGPGDGSLKVWDWGSGKLQQALVKNSNGYFRAVAFSKDSMRLVAGSTGPEVTRNNTNYLSSVVHCWEAKRWSRLWTVQGLYGEVWSLDLSPDGQRVARSDTSGTAVIDAALGRMQGYRMITPRYVDTEDFGAARVLWTAGCIRYGTMARKPSTIAAEPAPSTRPCGNLPPSKATFYSSSSYPVRGMPKRSGASRSFSTGSSRYPAGWNRPFQRRSTR